VIGLAASPAHHVLLGVGAIFTAIGLIFLLIGLIIRGASRRFGGRASRARGTIVDFDAHPPGMVGANRYFSWSGSGTGGGMQDFPTVEFTTADGTAVRATSHFGSNPRCGKVGETVSVLYDPGNPQRVRVDTPAGRGTCLELAFILMGIAVAALGIFILIASR
jgi:Protein of unknown function (DUF3592)